MQRGEGRRQETVSSYRPTNQPTTSLTSTLCFIISTNQQTNHLPNQPTLWCRRYDTATGDLVLVGLRYPCREENRKLCLERLHALLQEGQRKHPAPTHRFLLAQPLLPSMTAGAQG